MPLSDHSMVDSLRTALLGGAANAGGAAVSFFRRGGQWSVDPDDIPDFSLLDGVPRAFFLTDSLGVILRRNDAAAALATSLGVSPAAGQKIRALFGGTSEADAAIYRAMRSAADHGATIETIPVDGTALSGPARVEVTRHVSRQYFVWSIELLAPQQPKNLDEARSGIDLDRAPVGYFTVDRAGRIREMNRLMRDWVGLEEDAPDLPSLDALFPEDIGGLSPALARDGERIEERSLLCRLDGTRLPVRVYLQLSPNDDGGSIGQAIVVREMRRKAAGPDTEARRLVRFLDDAQIAFAVTSLDGIVLEANDRLAVMTDGAARVGAEISLAMRMEDREDVEARICLVAEGGSPGRPLDVHLSGETGREHEAQFYVHRIDTEQGEMLLTYVIDVSDQKSAEQQLAQVQKLHAVGQLAGGVAHDVNNVLTAIRGHCDLLMLRHHDGDPDFEHLSQIRDQTQRAANVISQLLAFSRQQTMKREIVQVADALDEIRFMLNPLVTERVTFKIRHARDLHPVRIDRSEFQRVVMNLSVNACQAMTSGGTLSVSTRNVTAGEIPGFGYPEIVSNDYVLIEMADTGSGIAPEHLGKIFEPFFSTKTAGKGTGGGSGTGLGLSTVYGIIKQMDGFIYCESELGKGTTFRIFLPRYRGSARPEARPRGVPRREPNDLTGKGRILLVEDEEAVRSFATKALELRGYSVMAANGGAEALEMLRAAPNEIDLIVSDVVMPDINGPEMMREAMKLRPDIRFIFISGYAEEAFRDEVMEGAKFDFLAKPFSLKDLAVAVKNAFGD